MPASQAGRQEFESPRPLSFMSTRPRSGESLLGAFLFGSSPEAFLGFEKGDFATEPRRNGLNGAIRAMNERYRKCVGTVRSTDASVRLLSPPFLLAEQLPRNPSSANRNLTTLPINPTCRRGGGLRVCSGSPVLGDRGASAPCLLDPAPDRGLTPPARVSGQTLNKGELISFSMRISERPIQRSTGTTGDLSRPQAQALAQHCIRMPWVDGQRPRTR